ncbi:hypothetical protein BLOT_009890 [Blomia tropicalis]|nr:hypothetical protein BLOT_009890 [Blomia tropicalis]
MARTTLTSSEHEFVRQYTRSMVTMSTIATAILATILLSAYTGQFDRILSFNNNNNESMIHLETSFKRMEYTLKHITIQLLWIILSMYWVIGHRLGTPALDPSNQREDLVWMPKNILTNTIEHGLVFIISQLIMVIDLDSVQCCRMIPTLNYIYLIGRIAYLIGYPSKRSFGFTICNFTIILTVMFNMYQLIILYY